MKNPRLITAFKILFILGIFIILLLNLDITELYQNLENIAWPWFSIVVFIAFLDQVIMGLKWNILLNTFNIHVPWIAPVLAYLRGKIFKLTAPSTLGIDAYKTYFLRNHYHCSTTAVATTIIIERFFGAVSSLLIICLLLYFSIPEFLPQLSDMVIILSVLGSISIFILVFLCIDFAQYLKPLNLPHWLPKFIIKGVRAITGNLHIIQKKPAKIWLYFILSTGEKISYGSAIYFAAYAMGYHELNYLYIISATPLMALLERLPVSISGIGLREGFMVLLLSPAGLGVTPAISIALVVRFAEIVLIILLAGVWFIKKDRFKKTGQTRGFILSCWRKFDETR